MIMSWKEFFEPTMLKIAIMILIFLFVPFNFYYHCLEGREYFFCVDKWTNVSIASLLQNFILHNDLPLEIITTPLFLPLMVGYLVISYLISCITVWIFGKIKKKK
jgi:hypothetical protein